MWLANFQNKKKITLFQTNVPFSTLPLKISDPILFLCVLYSWVMSLSEGFFKIMIFRFLTVELTLIKFFTKSVHYNFFLKITQTFFPQSPHSKSFLISVEQVGKESMQISLIVSEKKVHLFEKNSNFSLLGKTKDHGYVSL